ncbi:putative ATPase subunit of terminase (gpP-like) [Bacteriophage sp.]|nr:putative ATPase subunit of terminase (gpP-like) [Bacteriophage sp.]
MAETGGKIEKREHAAILLAEGDKTQAAVAKAVGVGERTIERWLTIPTFKARIEELKRLSAEQTRQDGIARKDNRLAAYQDIAKRIQMVIDGRAKELAGECNGGESGLLVRDFKGSGAFLQEVYKFDAALIRELNNTLKQAAIEKGQWTEKAELDLSGEVKIIKTPAKLSQDEWSAEQWEQSPKASE